MADQTNRGGHDRDAYGDDQGTRVGRPDTPARRDEELRGTDADEFRGPSSEPVKEGLEGAIFEDDDAGQGRGSTASGGASAHSEGRSHTGAGSEAAEGVHSVGGRDERSRSGVEQVRPSGDENPGSEPVRGRTHEHKGGYGGEGGAPRK